VESRIENTYYCIPNLNYLLSKGQIILFSSLLLFVSTSINAQLTPKKMGSLWGYVNSNNEWVIKPKLTKAEPFKHGMSAFSKKGKWGFIGENGSVAIKPKFNSVKNFSEDFAPVSLKINEQIIWGYIDYSGEISIPFQFTFAGLFSNGTAEVATLGLRKKEKVLINNLGEILSPAYQLITPVSSGCLLTNRRDDREKVYCYINQDGKATTSWYLNNFKIDEGNQKVWLPSTANDDQVPSDAFSGNINLKLYAYLNAKGQVISDWYEEIREEKGNHFVAKKNHKYGFINESYQPVTPFNYIEINTLDSNRYVAMYENATFIMVDLLGKELGKFHAGYETFEGYKSYLGKTEIALNDLRTFQKAIFDTLANQQSGWYDQIYHKHNQYYRVIENKNYLDQKKDTLYGAWYNHIVDSNKLIISDWRKCGEISWSGENLRRYKDSIYNFYHAPKTSYTITPGFFEEVFLLEIEFDKKKKSIQFNGGDFHDGMALVSRKVGNYTDSSNALTLSGEQFKYGFINWYGKLVIPYKFDYVSGFSDGKAIIRQGNKFGAIDYNGRTIIQPKFELMGNFGDGLAPIYQDSLWGYCDSRGGISLQPQYDEAHPFYYGYAAVKSDKKWGLIDRRGNVVLPFDYRKAPMAKSKTKVLILKDGVGLVEIDL
jgi:hypothetical protein